METAIKDLGFSFYATFESFNNGRMQSKKIYKKTENGIDYYVVFYNQDYYIRIFFNGKEYRGAFSVYYSNKPIAFLIPFEEEISLTQVLKDRVISATFKLLEEKTGKKIELEQVSPELALADYYLREFKSITGIDIKEDTTKVVKIKL